MPTPLTTRALRDDDYDSVVRLWSETDGVEVAEGDDRAGIAGYLRRNPDLSRVALVDGLVVGAVLCGHDGRRGLIYHLAVDARFRGCGIGRTLVAECIAGLRSLGLKRALILVAEDNHLGRDFWQSRGFEEISGATPFGLDLA